jgi:hypothetical protein
VAQNSANAFIARTGALYVGVQGSVTAPTAHDSALDADLKDLGYISSDGLAEKFEVNSESVTAFQNGDTIDSSITEATMTFEAVLIEAGNSHAVAQFYADDVDADDGSVLVSPGASAGRTACVVDMVSGTKFIRYWIPEAEFTKNGDVQYQNGQPVGYPVKVTCYPSSTLLKDDGSSASAKRWSSQLIVSS